MKTKKNKNVIQTNVLGGGNFSCRHPKLWSYIKSNVKAFFITGAITFVLTASATTILHSRQVRYKNDKSVEQAINELYEKAYECEMKKIGCIECTKLEYLESTGTQYIDTGITPNDNTGFYMDFLLNDLINRQDGRRMLGSSKRNGGDWGGITILSWQKFSGGQMTYKGISRMYNPMLISNERMWIKLYNNTYTSSTGANIVFSNGSLQNNVYGSFYIFNIHTEVDTSNYSKFKLYYFKIYDNDILVRDYVPVLDKNDRPCLFDKVSKTCFYNQGTGEFLYG